ncbi:MAG TPA: hypothetical protein VF056_04650 [Thermoleophilaceae bacterium]
MQWLSAAHQRSGKLSSAEPVGTLNAVLVLLEVDAPLLVGDEAAVVGMVRDGLITRLAE